MATGPETPGRLKDLIEGLRRGKGRRPDLDEAANAADESAEENDVDVQTESPNSDGAHEADEELQDLEKQLKDLRLERKKAHLRQQIEQEKDSLRTLQASAMNSGMLSLKTGPTMVPSQVSPNTGEPISSVDTSKEQKVLQILSFIWPEPVEQFQTFTLGGDVEFRIGKKKTLDKVTIEEWGYANIKIMQELVKQKRLTDINGYLNYTADVYRLAARNVWYSVLLYDKEYRQKQADELFEWGTYRQDLREFQLVSKRDNPTSRAFAEASKVAIKGRNPRQITDDRRKGPFLPDGREICRSFNYNSCYRADCKMMHNCAICFSSAHSALNGHNQPMTRPKNQEVPQNRD